MKSTYYFLGLFLVHPKQLNRCLHRKQTKINLFLWISLLIHFFPVFPFDLSWKHEKTKGFLIFSVGSTGNIRKKRVKLNGRSLTMLQPFHAEIYPEKCGCRSSLKLVSTLIKMSVDRITYLQRIQLLYDVPVNTFWEYCSLEWWLYFENYCIKHWNC